MRSIDFETYSINGIFTRPALFATRIFILNGIDIVMKAGQTYIVWTADFQMVTFGSFQINLTGQKAILNKMKYTILTIKTHILSLSSMYGSSKYHARI